MPKNGKVEPDTINRLLFFLMLFYVCQFYWGVKDIDDVVLIVVYLNDFIQDLKLILIDGTLRAEGYESNLIHSACRSS